MKTLVCLLLSILAAQLLFSNDVTAESIVLTWDANTEPDLAGYRIYYGVLDSDLLILDVGLATSVPIPNLEIGLTYRFYATAYNTAGLESGPSDEITYTLPALPVSDVDKDGLPDAFELAHDLNPLDPRDSETDSDGDQLTNHEEYLAGTDPGNLKSTLEISLFLPRTGGMGIQFESVLAQTYILEATDSFPDGEWFPLATDIEGTGGTIQSVDPSWNLSVRRMYRVTTSGRKKSGLFPALSVE